MPAENPITERQILTVSQLNRASKDLLETYLPLLWVEGELTNFAQPSSGHWYFTLKDSKAQVRCAMFRNRNMGVKFRPDNGQKVVVRGKVSLYEGRGDYQLIAEHMEPAGFGDLQRQFEWLKNALQEQGLFNSEHKQSLPQWPQKLGVITSPTGAAVHDILHVLKRRYPSLPVVIIPVAVQGVEAPAQIAQALHYANQHALCDVLIVARGGGSLEDLWAFNEEVVARAIFASQIPIISAVGHEVDFTIADFVADVRAPTPSAAAELVAPNQLDVQQQFQRHYRALQQATKQYLQQLQQRLQYTRARLKHPGDKLIRQAQALDQLELRLRRALKHVLANYKRRVEVVQRRLQQQSPSQLLQQNHNALNYLHKRLQAATSATLNSKQQQLHKIQRVLQSVSPLQTLNRGYAIVTDSNGSVLRDASTSKPGDTVQAQLQKGQLVCQVLSHPTSSD